MTREHERARYDAQVAARDLRIAIRRSPAYRAALWLTDRLSGR